MKVHQIDVFDHRSPQHEVVPLLVERWSPRAMSGESLPCSELARLFEAARWAPSSQNDQPWRFLYAHRDSPRWDVKVHATFLLLLAWVALVHWRAEGSVAAVLAGIGFILALFVCVVLHEYGHA